MKISKTVFNLQSGQNCMVEMAIFNVQREISSKLGKSELRLMSSACCIIELQICVKIHQNISNNFQLTGRTVVHGRNGYFQYLQCSKSCNSKGRLPEIWFLCSARRLMLFYICERFHENISNGFQHTERT